MTDNILVLLDVTPDGELAKSAAGLLGVAASLGTPVALLVGHGDHSEGLAAAAAEAGAGKVLIAAGDATAYVAATVDALSAAFDLTSPAAVLAAHSDQSKEALARFAMRGNSALSIDAINVSRDAEGIVAHHSAYGGAYTVTSSSTFGAPAITVRQGAIETRAVAAPLVVEQLAVSSSGRKAATVVSVDVADAPTTSRPELRGATKVVSGGRPRCRCRCISRRRRCRFRSAEFPGGPNWRAGCTAALYCSGNLRRDPAQGWYADFKNNHRDQ
jgi:electron transfer flavoprotein alpha subunit